jgi:hypothetical protein
MLAAHQQFVAGATEEQQVTSLYGSGMTYSPQSCRSHQKEAQQTSDHGLGDCNSTALCSAKWVTSWRCRGWVMHALSLTTRCIRGKLRAVTCSMQVIATRCTTTCNTASLEYVHHARLLLQGDERCPQKAAAAAANETRLASCLQIREGPFAGPCLCHTQFC